MKEFKYEKVLIPIDGESFFVDAVLTLVRREDYASTDRGEQDLSFTMIDDIELNCSENYSLEESEAIKNYFNDLKGTDYAEL